MSLFMLQMMQISLYRFSGENGEDGNNDKSGERSCMDLDQLDIDSREEGLAIRLAVEVALSNAVFLDVVLQVQNSSFLFDEKMYPIQCPYFSSTI